MVDPFDSMVRKCEHSNSQEEHLRRCGFCGESEETQAFFSGEESSPSEGFPVESTGIRICSLPDSSTLEETNQDDEYQKPPEERQMMSSEEMNRDPEEHGDSRIAEVDSKIDGVDSCKDISVSVAGTVVDLGRDTDLVFSGGGSLPEEGCLSQRGVGDRDGDVSGDLVGGNGGAEVSELESKENEMEVDLGFSESKNGGSVRVCKKVCVLGDSVDVSMAANVQKFGESSMEDKEGFLKSTNDNPSDSTKKSQLLLQKSAVSGENVDVTNISPVIPPPVVTVTGCIESEAAEHSEAPECSKRTSNVDLELKAAVNELRIEMNPEKVSESDNPQLHNGNENVRRDNAAEKSVDPASRVPSKDPPELRKLPDWVDEAAKNVIDEVSKNVTESSRRGQKRRSGRLAQGPGNGGRVNEGEEDGQRHGGERSAMEALITENPTQQPSSNPAQTSSNLLDLMNRLSRGINQNKEDNGDADVLEVAIRAGMNFPRPRWWRDGRGYFSKEDS